MTAQIIDFPSERVRRLVLHRQPQKVTVEERAMMAQCYRDMVLAGLSVREAAHEALTLAEVA